MSITIAHEQLMTFSELARALPRRRDGRPIHIATIHRWRSRGLRGIRLEAIRVGGAWHTSWEAFARFSSRLTAQANVSETTSSPEKSRNSPDDASTTLQEGGW